MAIISDKIIKALQYRIEQEELSSRLYKAMSIYLNLNGYIGAGKLFTEYASEENEHSKWVYDYLISLNIKPIVSVVEKPDDSFKGLPNIIVLAYKHELEITEQCKELSALCAKENDYMTMNLAQRVLEEQRAEIETTQTLVDMLKAFGDSKESLFLLDIELGKMARNG